MCLVCQEKYQSQRWLLTIPMGSFFCLHLFFWPQENMPEAFHVLHQVWCVFRPCLFIIAIFRLDYSLVFLILPWALRNKFKPSTFFTVHSLPLALTLPKLTRYEELRASFQQTQSMPCSFQHTCRMQNTSAFFPPMDLCGCETHRCCQDQASGQKLEWQNHAKPGNGQPS